MEIFRNNFYEIKILVSFNIHKIFNKAYIPNIIHFLSPEIGSYNIILYIIYTKQIRKYYEIVKC